MEIKVDMEHVGRRLDHLMELQELWGKGYAAARKSKDQDSYQSEGEIKKEQELEIALRLLGNYIMLGYSDAIYASDINNTAPLPLEDKKYFELPENHQLPEPKKFDPDKHEDYT